MSWGSALGINKTINLPLAEGLETAEDIPHTISFAILYRSRIDSLQELPKDKRPPRDLWNKPYKMQEFIDDVFKIDENKKDKSYADFDLEDVE